MLKNQYLEKVRSEKTIISIFLRSGIQLIGTLINFDAHVLILTANSGEQQLIYKRMIATIQPQCSERHDKNKHNRLFRR